MGDRGHNRHGPKRGGGVVHVPLSRSAGNPSNTMWPAPWSNSVPSGVFIHRALCPQQRRMPLAAYEYQYELLYLVVEMNTVTVRSDDGRYLLN